MGANTSEADFLKGLSRGRGRGRGSSLFYKSSPNAAGASVWSDFFFDSSGGAVSIAPSTGTISLLGSAPSRTLSIQVSTGGAVLQHGDVFFSTTANPDTGQVVFSGGAPTCAEGMGALSGIVILEGNAPSLQNYIVVSLSPSEGAVYDMGQVPAFVSAKLGEAGAVLLSGGTSSIGGAHSPSSGFVLAQGDAPTLAVIQGDLSPSAGAVSVEGYAPLIAREYGVFSGSVVLSGGTPTVNILEPFSNEAPLVAGMMVNMGTLLTRT